MVMTDLLQAATQRPAIVAVVVAAAIPLLLGGGMLISIMLMPFLPFLVVALVRYWRQHAATIQWKIIICQL